MESITFSSRAWRVAQAGTIAALLSIGAPAMAATVTNLDLVGGCPTDEDAAECFNASNATVANVALLVGQPESNVTQITTGYSVTGIDSQSGTWSVTDSSITHLAFKANGYYILGAVTGASGDWSTDVTDWTPDVTTLICPAGICNPDARNYTIADFLNGGGNVADLSNVRAFSVVPIPAAVWLFGSALAGLGFARRRKIA